MYLWQIRHIPNRWRILINSSALLAFLLMAARIGGFGVPVVLGQGDAKPAPAAGSNDKGAAEKKGAADEAGPDQGATDFMKKLHESLYARTSIRADIDQVVTIGAEKFQVTGHYVSGGQKLRLEYTIQPDQGIAGSLLEICDGKDLWSLIKVGDTTRVTHRDVQQIKLAAATSRNIPDVVLTAELGLGGLTALLASLERTMVYDAMKEETGGEGPRVVVQGRWKPEILARWPRTKENQLPDYLPDLVRVWVDPQAMFPVRLVYVKRVVEKEKRIYRPMISLKFSNVEFDGPINDRDFTFEPPDNVVPEDITRQFLDRMKKSAEAAAPPPKSTPANSSGK